MQQAHAAADAATKQQDRAPSRPKNRLHCPHLCLLATLPGSAENTVWFTDLRMNALFFFTSSHTS